MMTFAAAFEAICCFDDTAGDDTDAEAGGDVVRADVFRRRILVMS